MLLNRSRGRLATLAILSLAILTLGGCAGQNSAVLNRDLPAKPDWVEPVTTPDPKAGEDARLIAFRERVAKAKANARLVEFGDWYDKLRVFYAGESRNK